MHRGVKITLFILLASLLMNGCSQPGQAIDPAESDAAANPSAVVNVTPEANGTDSTISKRIEEPVPVTIDSKTYLFPVDDSHNQDLVHAAQTSQGIVWVTSPEMKNSESELDRVPLEPFVFYLHESTEESVTIPNSKPLYKLPLQDDDGNWYFPSGLYGGIRNHVLIDTYRRKPGMAQPKFCELLDLDLTTGEAKTIITYHDTGGFMFDVAIDDQTGDVITVQGTPIEADLANEVRVYHTATGTSEKIQKFSKGQGRIVYWIGNKSFAAPFADIYN